MAGEQVQFDGLLQNLLSTDNKIRMEAEETYESVPATTKIPLLINTMTNVTCQHEVRSMAAVLLRRIYTASFEEFWPQFPPEAQAQLKERTLLSIQSEPNAALRKKICECGAEFARNLLDDEGNNTWPEILKFLFECASIGNVEMKESALIIFSIVPGIFGNQQNQYIDNIKQMLHQCLIDPSNAGVRFTAARATVAFVLANDSETSVLNHFKDLLPFIIQIVAESLQTDDDTLLKCLIDLAESTPKFLRHQLDLVFNLCLKVLSDTNMSDQWRQLALEVVVTMSETAPAIVRKAGKFIGLLVPQILMLMVDLDDDADWSVADEIEDDDSDSNPIAGESALDRLACGLGGKTMLPHITNNIPPMLQNADWRYRHAALMAISACGEGCHQQMEHILGSIVEAILPFLQDQHPRVRYAACNALGQMATDFGPTFQKKFHQKVVNGLLLVMDDYVNPRVQAHAGAALVNFSEDCPKNILTPYLDLIIAKLEQVLTTKFKELLEKGTKLVLEQIVTTLASVADTAEEKFEQYYDRFMPCLKYIVQNAVSKELRMLRGKTIECISLIGLAVGRDKFMQDCSDVMQLLLKTQTEMQDMPEDDPQISYMISAWARMCKIMGKDFEQYLPLVMGPVLKAAALKPEVALLDSDDMKVMENDSDWQFVTLGDQQSFGIRTSGLEEKATACQMLVCYARELKEGFAAYTEDVVKIMVAHLKFYFHDGVRVAAAESLPFLLECARIRGPEYLAQMWQYICPELLKAVDSEPEPDVKSEHMYAIAQCIELMGKGCLTDEQITELVRLLDKILNEHFTRQAARQEQRKDEDYDDVVEESLLNEDDQDVYILSKVSDIMHALLGKYKEAMLPVFEQLLPHFVKLLGADRPWPDRQWSLCIFDDLLEHVGPLSQQYQQYFLQPLMQCIVDKQPEIRQAAAYGVGVMAQFAGPGYIQALTEMLPLLVRVIEDPEARAPENLSPTENAISAVTKVLKYGAVPGAADVLPRWLSWLPVWEDDEEALHIYGYFCDLVEANHPVILGENNQNLPRIVSVVAEAFQHEALPTTSEVGARMLNIVRLVMSQEAIFQACVSQLTPAAQQALSRVLSS
jgi:hypothetical protein